ncbi:MAG: hypothetical protein QXI60_02635 [Thermofilaceae archaeon]
MTLADMATLFWSGMSLIFCVLWVLEARRENGLHRVTAKEVAYVVAAVICSLLARLAAT